MKKKDHFPLYSMYYDVDNQNSNYEKIRSVANYFVQLYYKSDDYICDKEKINMLTLIFMCSYIYNDLPFTDCSFFSYQGKGVYVTELFNLINHYPFIFFGKKNPCGRKIYFSNPLTDISECFKLTYRFKPEEEKLMQDIFVNFAYRDTPELYREFNDTGVMYKREKYLIICHDSTNLLRSAHPITVYNQDDAKNEVKKLNEKSSFGKFILNYDFSKIRFNAIFDKESAQSRANSYRKLIKEDF